MDKIFGSKKDFLSLMQKKRSELSKPRKFPFMPFTSAVPKLISISSASKLEVRVNPSHQAAKKTPSNT